MTFLIINNDSPKIALCFSRGRNLRIHRLGTHLIKFKYNDFFFNVFYETKDLSTMSKKIKWCIK